jgi:hypothetical protein
MGVNTGDTKMERTQFEARLTEFLEAGNAFVAKEHEARGYQWPAPKLEVERGPKFVRVCRVDSGSRSAYCFLDYEGVIWKPKGWKGPERKNPRGSIFDENFSLGKGLTVYGTSYLR